MQDSIFIVTCDDLFPLRARSWGDSLESPKGLVVLVHGMAEYGDRYDSFALALKQAGYRVWCGDHRGHGLNIGDLNPNGHIADKDSLGRAVRDVHSVVTHAFEMGLPVILMGHSFGTSVVRKFLVDYRDGLAGRLSGVLLSSTVGRTGTLYYAAGVIPALEGLVGGPTQPSLMNGLVFGAYNAPFEKRTDWDWISSDPAVVDSYIQDPLCGFDCTAAFWRDHLWGLPGLQAAEEEGKFAVVPSVLLLAGTDDPLSSGGQSNGELGELYSREGIRVVDYRVPLGRHEVLSDPFVVSQVLGWLGALG